MAITPSEFINRYAPYAMEQQVKYGIPSSVILAQMALESSWGSSALARNDNNFFGIKRGSSWTGRVSYYDDDRPQEAFRSYDNVGQSLSDHSATLLQSRYLRRCPVNDSTDHLGWIRGIKAGGYATASDYVERIEEVIGKYGLERFDRLAVQTAQQQGLQIGYMRGRPTNYAPPTSPSASPGILLNPLQGRWCMPINLEGLRVSGEYGEKRPGHLHGGIDISTKGQYLPIYGTEDNGKVTAVKPNNGTAGNMLTVEYNRADGSRLQCTYMHLSKIDVNVGDAVGAGTPLGYSGNTGRSTGAHLHFETKFFNAKGELQSYDPAEYLAELSFRGNLPVPLDKGGQSLVARYAAQMAYNNAANTGMAIQPMGNQEGMTLAGITGSDDPNRWLEYLMNKNGEKAEMNNPLSGLLSSLFMSIMTLAQELQQADTASSLNTPEKEENKETKEAASIRRDRESVDVKRLAQSASLNFDSELPEEQQANTIRRT